jgi:hypothetical protein
MSFRSSRRGFLLGAGALGLAPLQGETTNNGRDDIKLAVATYSLRGYQRDLAIKMIKELNVHYASVKEYHLPYNDTPEQLAHGRKKFQEAGIEIVAGGVIYLTRTAMPIFAATSSTPRPAAAAHDGHRAHGETMPRIERFVKEYNIKIAIHNHGPEDKHFPPRRALSAS